MTTLQCASCSGTEVTTLQFRDCNKRLLYERCANTPKHMTILAWTCKVIVGCFIVAECVGDFVTGDLDTLVSMTGRLCSNSIL